jgi:hypothetical protein
MGDGTNSTSSNTGTLIVNGGIGLSQDIVVGGIAKISSNIDATSTSTGSLTVVGGLGVGRSAYFGTGIYLPTSGGVPTLLSVYEVLVDAAFQLSGPYASPITITVTYVAVGRMCTMSVGSSTGGDISSPATIATYISGGTTPYSYPVPSRFRPITDLELLMFAINNSAAVAGSSRLYKTGMLRICRTYDYNANTAFVTTGDAGCLPFSYSYVIN